MTEKNSVHPDAQGGSPLPAPDDGWLTKRTAFALVAMGLAVITIANDFTAFSVAIPTMEKQLHASLSTVQWVLNAYALVFGVAIVTGGRLADMFGRRRVFLIGTAIFALFSLASGLAPDALSLIIFRGLMGIGGALMWPAILGLTFDLLPESKAGLAGGLVIAAAGLGNAIGPLVGGALTQALSWRWIFLVNLPIAGLAAAATWWTIPHDKAVAPGQRLDYAGVATLSGGLIALLLALDFSSSWGWSSSRVELIVVVAVVLLVAFVVQERRAKESALLPPDVLRNRSFVAACRVRPVHLARLLRRVALRSPDPDQGAGLRPADGRPRPAPHDGHLRPGVARGRPLLLAHRRPLVGVGRRRRHHHRHGPARRSSPPVPPTCHCCRACWSSASASPSSTPR